MLEFRLQAVSTPEKPVTDRLKPGLQRLFTKHEVSHSEDRGSPVPEDLLPPLLSFHLQAEKWLVKNKPSTWRDDLLQLFFDVSTFLRVADRFDASYPTCTSSDGQDLQIKLFCLFGSRS